jgi:hypothetical protein
MQIEKVSYQVNWKAFRRGTSIFIPCLDPARAKREVRPVMDRLRFSVVMKSVVEDGVRGLRIWRV